MKILVWFSRNRFESHFVTQGLFLRCLFFCPGPHNNTKWVHFHLQRVDPFVDVCVAG